MKKLHLQEFFFLLKYYKSSVLYMQPISVWTSNISGVQGPHTARGYLLNTAALESYRTG